MIENRCSNCRFYDGDYCRRHPPKPYDRWHFSLIAMLQAIARAQLKISGIPDDDNYVDEMVFQEVTEQYEGHCKFPLVNEKDWCGEWETDDYRFGVFHSGGVRVRADELASYEAKLDAIRAKEKAS